VNKIDIKSMYLTELQELMVSLKQPKFRAGQIFKWLQSGVCNFDEMTNIPSNLRGSLQEG
jgi:23S rRNA (adenine2503-C2)-methyltransferase